MIYPQNFEQKIGFDQIRQLLKKKYTWRRTGDGHGILQIFGEVERLDQVTEFVQEEDNFLTNTF